jgi:hypothetical protein
VLSTTEAAPTTAYTTPTAEMCSFCHIDPVWDENSYGWCLSCLVVLHWDTTGAKIRRSKRILNREARKYRTAYDPTEPRCQTCFGTVPDLEAHVCVMDPLLDVGDLFDLDESGHEYRVA